VVVAQDCRGRFRSKVPSSPSSTRPGTLRHGQWAARLPGADGRVAMYGFSYPGATAARGHGRPPSLVAICPGMTASRYYEGWTYQGGALNLAFAANWSAGLAAYTAITAGDGPEISRLEGLLGSAGWFSHLPLLEPPGLSRPMPLLLRVAQHPPTTSTGGRPRSTRTTGGSRCPAFTSEAGTTSSSPARSRTSPACNG
jgi:predicted acyl esterase